MMKRTIIFLAIIVCCFSCNNETGYKEFTSEQDWFTIQLPDNWSETKDNEGTYIFYDEENWKGTFRITPIRLDSRKVKDTVTDLLARQLKDKASKGAKMVKIGDFDCVFYKEYVQETSGEVLMYKWTLGSSNTVFLVSYATKKEIEATESHPEELRQVENVIKSLQIK
ncbi:DUF3805 domain-containing protein [Rufibacter immobilis]|nr:DUF3805 domain-containing protein [Rufibacter immobilis]